MNDASLNDPVYLLVGAVSLLFVLVTLYRGGWAYVVVVAVALLFAVIKWTLCIGLLVAAFDFTLAVFGSEEERAASFLRGIIIVASIIATWQALFTENRFTRFLWEWFPYLNPLHEESLHD